MRMRKPITTIVALFVLGCLVFAAGKVVTRAEGPCAPKDPKPTGAAG